MRLVNNAQSATVRAIGPLVRYVSKLRGGEMGTRPYGGLYPTTPQHDAGTRIEPAMSPPVARVVMPAASAAADPPDEPPTS